MGFMVLAFSPSVLQRVLRMPAGSARSWLWGVLLALAAGWFSPLVKAEAFEVVCSGGESGVLVVTETQDDLSHALLHGRTCAFCMPVSMAPPPALLPVVPAATLPVAEPVATLPASVPARFPAHRLARAPPASRLL